MLRECREALAARGSTVIHEGVGEAVGREAAGDAAADIVDWRHYPEGEVYDPASHVQYFYHRHPPHKLAAPDAAGRAEHGHFHLFLGGEGIPAGMAPLLLPEIAVANAALPRQSAPLKRGGSDEICHLVAIAVNAQGDPIRLFTTNRWVTGETWYRAEDVIGMLGRVRFAHSEKPALLNRWIEALVRLFQPEIAVLLRQRDQVIVDWRWRWPRGNVFDDPRLEIASSFDIDIEARIAVAPGAARGARLPSMAEGWGA